MPSWGRNYAVIDNNLLEIFAMLIEEKLTEQNGRKSITI